MNTQLGVADFTGIGGNLRMEWVAGFLWNRWQPSSGICNLERIGLPAPIVNRLEQNAIDQLAAAHNQGCQILFGTDVGYMADADTRQEFYLMGEAGLGFDDILGSLTTEPSNLFDVFHYQGAVKEDFQADLVVLNADPRVDLKAFSDVYMVIKKGKVVYQNAL